MQLRRIGILVVAAAVLVVMTGGNAFAMHFDGSLTSALTGSTYPDWYVTKSSDPSGHYYPSVGEAVDWYNYAQNTGR